MVTQNFLQGVWHELRELWRGSNDPISTWGIWLYLLLVALADPSVVFFVIAAAQAENVVVPLGWSSGMEFSSTSCLPLASSYLSTSASTKAQNVQNVRDTCPAVAVAISSLRGFGRTEFSESEKPGNTSYTSSIQQFFLQIFTVCVVFFFLNRAWITQPRTPSWAPASAVASQKRVIAARFGHGHFFPPTLWLEPADSGVTLRSSNYPFLRLFGYSISSRFQYFVGEYWNLYGTVRLQVFPMFSVPSMYQCLTVTTGLGRWWMLQALHTWEGCRYRQQSPRTNLAHLAARKVP